MGWPVTTVTKTLLAASSTSIGSFSTAAGGTVTLSCVTLDTARRIIVACSTTFGIPTTLTGLNDTGQVIRETVFPSTGVGNSSATGTTTQDFIKVTSITFSCAITTSSGGGLFGTSTQGGTPWYTVDKTRNPMNIGFNLVPASSLTQTSFEYTQDAPVFDPVSNTWTGCAFPTRGPLPTISSLGSSVIGPSATQGYIQTPIAAWRITLSSCSSALGATTAAVTQLGV